jgi:hypothetical protein
MLNLTQHVAFLALTSYYFVLTDARPATLFTLASLVVVLVDARPAVFLDRLLITL